MPDDADTTFDSDMFGAALDLLRRCGASQTQVRWSDDTEPTVWFVVAVLPDRRWDTAAGADPLVAALRLCEAMVDGAECKHCARPTGVVDDPGDMPLDEIICWYQYDPELKTFRRGCEGDDR